MKLTIKQKRFADEYIISTNATQSAITAGYSKKYANTNASKLLQNTTIKSYIDERLKELEDHKIAKQEEILKILTAHARRETIEYNVTKDGEVVETPTSVANSIKAADLLGRRYGISKDDLDREQQKVNTDLAKAKINSLVNTDDRDDKLNKLLDIVEGNFNDE